MKRKRPKKAPKEVQSLSLPKAKRKNIPTTRHQPLKPEEQQKPKRIVYSHPHFNLSQALRDTFQRRAVGMDPQLAWENKETTSPTELTANMPPLYIQEKVHPKAIIDDLLRQSHQSQAQSMTVLSKMRNLKIYGLGASLS